MAASSPKTHLKPTAASKHALALQKKYAKQQNRKIRSGLLPASNLDIDLEDYASFVSHLQSSTRVLALLGAGLSAASGIPTFRGAGGFWREHNAMDLASPEAFEKDPALLWQFYNYRRHMALKAIPNKAHISLAKLAAKKPDFLAISQNIDGLSERAKHPAANLQTLHGSLFNVRCSNVQCKYTLEDDFRDPIVPALQIPEEHDISSTKFPLKDIPHSELPTCPQCQSLLRPAVVWFGEPLAMSARDRIHSWLDIGKVDLMLVIGTSATVWPAANYIYAARLAGARIAVFNMEDPDDEDGSGGMREEGWFFKGDASEIVPELTKEVIGPVHMKDGR
ncbi:MAG: hypothetical protein Q9174_001605 [Haloplaca sp. 1 TL-2023]